MIDKDKVQELLEKRLPATIRSFEVRPQQQKMLEAAVDAYNLDQIALIEAGTGTGKSLAYLLPALLWAAEKKQRTLISTHTITLQEQLLKKDIPLAKEALGLQLKAVLVKGMNNYVCLRKLDEAKLFPTPEIDAIEEWANTTKDGTKSSLPMVPSASVWEEVSAESDTCTKNHCPFYKECHFFKARRDAEDAQILVANHHLLFADLAADNAFLPQYERIIIDEAHHIEDVATEFFGAKASRYNMLRIVGRLQGEKSGKVPALKNKIMSHYLTRNTPTEIQELLNTVNIDLPPLRHDLLKNIVDAFDALQEFLQEEGKKRLLDTHLDHPFWGEEIVPAVQRLIDTAKHYVQHLDALESRLKQLEDHDLDEMTRGIRFEIDAMATRLAESCLVFSNFVATKIPEDHVRWLEASKLKTMINTRLVDAKLDVAQTLRTFLFEKFSTVILCSATLTTNKEFTFMRKRLGLTEELPVTENIFDSPFNYQQQTLFAIPNDLPAPTHPDFRARASEAILEAIKASHGNAFVLFTSYSMMQQCYRELEDKLDGYILLKQGDTNRQALLEKFKNTNRSVLFGTDSFWEGVDVVGDALRSVIIAKLPFRVPSEPIIEARTEAIDKAGGDSFWEYALPSAIVKFKQGFGRLIRNKKDRGCVICLDTRLMTKNYGKVFLNSLPACQMLMTDSASLWPAMREFYRKTWHLTK